MINNGDPDNHLDIVQLLIDRGVDLNQYGESGYTALILGRFEYSKIHYLKKLTLMKLQPVKTDSLVLFNC